jgi:hypothetical protein
MTLAVLQLLVQEARACTCLEYGTPPCAAYWRADAVFAGYVTDIKPLETSKDELPQASLHFIIEESYRGIAAAEVNVATLSGTSCDMKFEKGERWLVYAYLDKAHNRLEIRPCTRTNLLAQSAEDLDYLNGLKQKMAVQSISGRVLQDRYAPLSDVKVIVEGGGNKIETATDKEGIYRVAIPQAGVYTVRALVQFAAAVMSFGEGEKIEAQPTDEQTIIQYTLNIAERHCNYTELDVYKIDLHATAEIGGKVLDASGQPLTPGYIHLMNAEDASDRRSIKIEENGRFKFEGVAAGRYFLVINPDNGPPGEDAAPYPRTFYSGVSSLSQATPISVSEGAKLENIIFRVGSPLKARVLTGRVVWADGAVVQKAFVSLYNGQNGSYIRMFKTDAKGNFNTKLYGDFKYEVAAEMVGPRNGRGERVKVPSTAKLKPLKLVIKPE